MTEDIDLDKRIAELHRKGDRASLKEALELEARKYLAGTISGRDANTGKVRVKE